MLRKSGAIRPFGNTGSNNSGAGFRKYLVESIDCEGISIPPASTTSRSNLFQSSADDSVSTGFCACYDHSCPAPPSRILDNLGHSPKADSSRPRIKRLPRLTAVY